LVEQVQSATPHELAAVRGKVPGAESHPIQIHDQHPALTEQVEYLSAGTAVAGHERFDGRGVVTDEAEQLPRQQGVGLGVLHMISMAWALMLSDRGAWLSHLLERTSREVLQGEYLRRHAVEVVARGVVFDIHDFSRVDNRTFSPVSGQNLLHYFENYRPIEHAMAARALWRLLDKLRSDRLAPEPNAKKKVRRSRDIRDEVTAFFDDKVWNTRRSLRPNNQAPLHLTFGK
jgi:hypothetical protein